MRLRIAVLAAFLAACGRDPRVALSDEFAPNERVEIARAAAKWNTILRQPMSIEGGPAPWKIVREETPEMVTKGWSGETSHPRRTIFIKPGINETVFYALVLHEFGHVNGLHDISGDGVMNHYVGTVEFTAADLEECQTVGACGLSPVDEAKCRLQGACP